MTFPSHVDVFQFQVSVWWIFLAVGYVVAAYVFWWEGVREGFDQLKLFDLIFLTLLLSFLALVVDGLLVVSLIILAVFFVSQLWKWSTFRILDIFSIAALAGFIPVLVGISVIAGNYLLILAAVPVLLLQKFLLKARNARLKSGYTFSLVLLIGIFISTFIYAEIRHLIFYIFLFSISLINLYLRERKNMIKPKLSVDFLRRIKNNLLKKSKRLDAEQNLLMQEDPYMQDGRSQDNAELTDDAILEDAQKEWNEARRSSLTRVQIGVRKALARINIGTYGTCEVCGSPIDKARLEAYPEASTCIEHAASDSENL
jgi:DnaK suppressor protein